MVVRLNCVQRALNKFAQVPAGEHQLLFWKRIKFARFLWETFQDLGFLEISMILYLYWFFIFLIRLNRISTLKFKIFKNDDSHKNQHHKTEFQLFLLWIWRWLLRVFHILIYLNTKIQWDVSSSIFPKLIEIQLKPRPSIPIEFNQLDKWEPDSDFYRPPSARKSMGFISKSHNLRPPYFHSFCMNSSNDSEKIVRRACDGNFLFRASLKIGWSPHRVNKTVYWAPDSTALHYVYPNKCHFMSQYIN